jgi:hypothetical protein
MDDLEELSRTIDFVQKRRALLLRQLEELDELTPRLLRLASLLRETSYVEETSRVEAAMSVYNKVVKLLEENSRVFKAEEIMDEWERRGDPIQGSNPKAALRTALSEAVKKGRLNRVSEGEYMASLWLDHFTTVDLKDFPSIDGSEPGGWPSGLSILSGE